MANHNISFIQTGPNEQKVWFFIDNSSFDPSLPHQNIYYNRRSRANSSSPWYWEFSVSPAVIPWGATAGAVLYSPTPKYTDLRTYTSYSYVMYQVIQPPECITESASYLWVAYSNDGICWTSKQLAVRYGGPYSNCLGISNTVPVEQVTGFAAGQLIQLMGAEGTVSYLTQREHMDETADVGYAYAFTYWQTNVGRDYASVSFIRDGQGNLIRDNGVASFFAGDTAMLSKSNGLCRVTGLERNTLLTVP